MQLKEKGKIEELRRKYPFLYHITGRAIEQIEPSKVYRDESGEVHPVLDTCDEQVLDERGNPRDAVFATASEINREFYALRDTSRKENINWAMQDPISKNRIFMFDKIKDKYWEYPLSSQDFVPIVPSKTEGNRIEGEYNEYDGEWISVSGNPVRVDQQNPKDTKEILKKTKAMVFTITPEGKEFLKENFLKDGNWDRKAIHKALEKGELKEWVKNGYLNFKNQENFEQGMVNDCSATSVLQDMGTEVRNVPKNIRQGVAQRG